MSALGLMLCIIRGKPYNYVQLCIAQCHVEFENLIVQYLCASLLELKSEGLNLKFDQLSEVTFSGKLPST